MTRRLSRRAPIWQAALAVVPLALGLGALLMSESAEVSERGTPAARLPVDPLAASERSKEEPPRDPPSSTGPRPLPPALAVVHLQRGIDAISVNDLATIVASPARTPSERYVALRRLERDAPSAAVVEAEKVAMANEEGADTFLALNALGALARHPEGQTSLRRCAAKASSKAVRDTATRLAAAR